MELATLGARDRDHHDKALTARATVGRVRHVGKKRYADLHPEARTSVRWCRNHHNRSGAAVHDLIRDRSEKRAADGGAPGGADHDDERVVFAGDTEIASAGRSSTSSTATETDASRSWATSTALPYTLTSATTLKRTRTPSSVNSKTSCARALSSMPMTDPRHRHDEPDPGDEVVCQADDQQTYTWGAH
jgi:hypothetical protein